MNIPAHLQILAGIVTLASVSGVVLLICLTMQLLRGRFHAALRTAVVTLVLAIVACAAALPLGLTPISGTLAAALTPPHGH